MTSFICGVIVGAITVFVLGFVFVMLYWGLMPRFRSDTELAAREPGLLKIRPGVKLK